MIPFGQINGPPTFGPGQHMNHRASHHHQSPQMAQQPPTLQQSAYDRYQLENRGGTTYFYTEPTEAGPDDEQYTEAEAPDGSILVVCFAIRLKGGITVQKLLYLNENHRKDRIS